MEEVLEVEVEAATFFNQTPMDMFELSNSCSHDQGVPLVVQALFCVKLVEPDRSLLPDDNGRSLLRCVTEPSESVLFRRCLLYLFQAYPMGAEKGRHSAATPV